MLAIVASLLLAQQTSSPASIEIPAVQAWLKQSAIPLKSVTAGAGFDDLNRLKPALKDVRLVGLGEATHGSREFFQFKHRMLEFLVKELGYNLFVIEATYPGTLAIDEYVRTGKGDRATLLRGMRFWTWNTEEVLAMVDWMRAHNRNLPLEKQVRFFGNDVQSGIEVGGARLRAFFAAHDPERLPEVETVLKGMQAMNVPPTQTLPSEEAMVPVRSALTSLAERLATVRSKAPKEEADVVENLIRIGGQYVDLQLTRSADRARGSAVRDRAMADNTLHLMRQLGPQTKAAVWAHNGHIAKRVQSPVTKVELMGLHLQRSLDKAYYAMGFAFNEGQFQARQSDRNASDFSQLREFSVAASPSGWLGNVFAGSGVGNFVVDLRQAPTSGPVADYFQGVRMSRGAGAAWTDAWEKIPATAERLTPRSDYDALIFIDRTTRARPLASSSRG